MTQPLRPAARDGGIVTAACNSEPLAIVSAALRDLIDTDEVIWTDISAIGGAARALSGPQLHYDGELSAGLSRLGLDHPAVRSYLRVNDDRAPRRISDVMPSRSWLSSPVYAEVFARRGARFQLSLVTSLDAASGRGWVLARDARDFNDRDVATARALLPMLSMLERLTAVRPDLDRDSAVALTARESEVLDLLSLGVTARSIAHTRGITEATVRKHLERIYRKLGTNDRLSAVRRAQQLGLLAR